MVFPTGYPTVGGQNSNDDGQNRPEVNFTIRDHDGETTTFGGYIFQPTAANLPDVLLDIGAVRESIQELILGVVAKEMGQFTNTPLDNRKASDPNAQRERKFLIKSIDTREFLDQVAAVRNPNFQEPVRAELGTVRVSDPDGNSLMLEGTEQVDMANPYVAAFVTAYETLFRSKAIGTLEVQEILLVGRNI